MPQGYTRFIPALSSACAGVPTRGPARPARVGLESPIPRRAAARLDRASQPDDGRPPAAPPKGARGCHTNNGMPTKQGKSPRKSLAAQIVTRLSQDLRPIRPVERVQEAVHDCTTPCRARMPQERAAPLARDDLAKGHARAWRGDFGALAAICAPPCPPPDAHTRATRRHSRGAAPGAAGVFRRKDIFRRCGKQPPSIGEIRTPWRRGGGIGVARGLSKSSTATDNYRHTPLGVPVVVDS